jgi:hypothetical protein
VDALPNSRKFETPIKSVMAHGPGRRYLTHPQASRSSFLLGSQYTDHFTATSVRVSAFVDGVLNSSLFDTNEGVS